MYALYNIKKWKSDQSEFERCTRKVYSQYSKFFSHFKYFTEGAHELNLINELSSEIKVL